jgi:hypothetical protein
MSTTSLKRVILETSEGANTHAVNATNKPIDYSQLENNAVMFIVHDKAVVTHEEHDKIVLDKGTFYKTNQVEFNPFDNTISRVFD